MKKALLVWLCISYHFAISQTTLTLQPGTEGKDTHIWSVDVNATSGAADYMGASAWTWSSIAGVQRMLLGFDLSSIPSGAQIIDAKLTLTYFYNAGFSSNGDNALYIRRITSAWDESTVTWATQPTVSTANTVSVPSFTMGNSITDVDVTALVSDMVADPTNSYGFTVVLQTESTYRVFNACTSEHATAANRPKLVVTYTTATDITESQKEEIRMEVYPNPSNTKVEVKAKKSIDQLVLMDGQGKTVASVNGSSINVEGYPVGIYCIKVLFEDQTSEYGKVMIAE